MTVHAGARRTPSERFSSSAQLRISLLLSHLVLDPMTPIAQGLGVTFVHPTPCCRPCSAPGPGSARFPSATSEIIRSIDIAQMAHSGTGVDAYPETKVSTTAPHDRHRYS